MPKGAAFGHPLSRPGLEQENLLCDPCYERADSEEAGSGRADRCKGRATEVARDHVSNQSGDDTAEHSDDDRHHSLRR